MNFNANWTCGKCKRKFRDSVDGVKEKGCVACSAPYEKLTHIPVVVCDSREQRSGIPAELERIGVEVIIVPNLLVGDYVVSDRVAIEMKEAKDYLQDWISNRELFSKIHDIKMAYSRPILMLRGYTGELFEARGIDPTKVQACIFTIARMGVPMVEVLNVAGAAQALKWYAEKEQNEDKRLIQLHGKRSHLSKSEQLEYIVSAIPEIGRGTAISLLSHFGSIDKIATASVESLQEVPGIDKTALKIREIMTRNYEVKK